MIQLLVSVCITLAIGMSIRRVLTPLRTAAFALASVNTFLTITQLQADRPVVYPFLIVAVALLFWERRLPI